MGTAGTAWSILDGVVVAAAVFVWILLLARKTWGARVAGCLGIFVIHAWTLTELLTPHVGRSGGALVVLPLGLVFLFGGCLRPDGWGRLAALFCAMGGGLLLWLAPMPWLVANGDVAARTAVLFVHVAVVIAVRWPQATPAASDPDVGEVFK